MKEVKATPWRGEKIAAPGFYSGIPIAYYHTKNICDGISISSSGLRTIFNKSPAHYWITSPLNIDRIEEDDKRAFILGRAAHKLLLGEANFRKEFAIEPTEWPDEHGIVKPWHNNRTVCKRWHSEREKEGRSVLLPREAEAIIGMSQSIKRNPIARDALSGLVECSGFIRDEETNVWLKIRPDSLPVHSGDYVDLKTTLSVQWHDLQRTIFDYGYHMQFALIRSVIRQLGLPFGSATLVFVESKPPYCARLVALKDGDLELGDRQNRIALKLFVHCYKNRHWPGPGDGDVEPISLPDWATGQIENKLKATRG
jgi:hypothetical protein